MPRNTPIRQALIELLSKNQEPQTTQELLLALEKKGLAANKTTIYRQLETLENYGIIQTVHFNDRAVRYELRDNEHHHHLVCLKCDCVQDFSFPTDLKEQEQNIWKKNKFKVLRHSLEFFGICERCQ